MPLKKILFITTVPQMIAQFLLPYSDHFRRHGVRVDAMAAGIDNFPQIKNHFDYCWDVDFSRNPFDLKNMLLAPESIRRIVERHQYQIVHVHSPIASFVTRLALRHINYKRPQIIYTAHGFHFFKGGNPLTNIIYLLLEKLASKWTDQLVVINEEDKKAALKFKLITPERLNYMHGIGVPVEEYRAKNISSNDIESLRKEFNLHDQDKIFLMVAEFTPQKNHQFIIEAFSELQRSSAYLFFAGVGSELNKMKELVKKKKLEKNIIFLGYRSDIPLLIHAASAVVLVSQREGLPRSILEAMCVGKPIIGTDIRGIRDLLSDGSGILIRKNNKEDLISAIQLILDNPGESSAMVQKGLEKINRYDLPEIISHHEKLYEKALT